MSRDHHSKPFDEGTLTKLALYRAYLKAWLPTFAGGKTPHINRVNIFDFFAGPGNDRLGQQGSPVIALEVIEGQKDLLARKGIAAFLYLNEYDSTKKSHLDFLVAESQQQSHVSIHTESLEFGEAFEKWLPLMEVPGSANFLFLDQSGVKHITSEVFQRIIQIRTTDFLFFVSSSKLHRFRDQPEVCRYLKLPPETIETMDYYEIHRRLVDFYRALVPEGMEMHLAPFSIKKRSNIYGLIFGSHHILGLHKFLTAAWTVDPIRGEATYDVDREGIHEIQKSLFPEMDIPKKLTRFWGEISGKILSGELDTNRGIYLFTMEQGFLPEHAKKCLERLKEEGRLPKQSVPLSYEKAWKKPPRRIILKEDAHG